MDSDSDSELFVEFEPMASLASNEPSTKFCIQMPDPIDEELGDSQITDRESSEPMRMAVLTNRVWDKKTLTVSFRGGSAKVRQMVEKYAHQWSKHANITFVFVTGWAADIRVAIQRGGSKSFVGTAAKGIAPDKPTMWLGFDDWTPEERVSRTTLHEFGHALGAIHEHSAPTSPIQWNRDAVIKSYLRGVTDPEDKEKMIKLATHNVLRKYPGEPTTQFSHFDPDSIMIYPIPIEWTTNGFHCEMNRVLSPTDIDFIGKLYPFDPVHPPGPNPGPSPPIAPAIKNFSRSLTASPGGNTSCIAYSTYTSNLPMQSYGGSGSPLPGMCVTKLVLGSQVEQILLSATSNDADSTRYMVQVQAWRSWTSCQQIDLSWLEIPYNYPGLQHGVFRQGHRVPSASGNDFWTARVNFDRPFASTPKVVVFFTQFYVQCSTNWKANAGAQDIDRWGFTISISAAARNPQTNTNYVLTWIAHESNAAHIASGDVGEAFSQSSSSSGHVDFGKTFSRQPIVLAGLNFFEFRYANSMSIELGTRAVTTTGLDWFMNYQHSPFGGAFGSYIAFGT